MLDVQNLRVSLGGKTILDGLTLTARLWLTLTDCLWLTLTACG